MTTLTIISISPPLPHKKSMLPTFPLPHIIGLLCPTQAKPLLCPSRSLFPPNPLQHPLTSTLPLPHLAAPEPASNTHRGDGVHHLRVACAFLAHIQLHHAQTKGGHLQMQKHRLELTLAMLMSRLMKVVSRMCTAKDGVTCDPSTPSIAARSRQKSRHSSYSRGS